MSAALRLCWASLYCEDMDGADEAVDLVLDAAGERPALRAEALRMRAIVAMARHDGPNAVATCEEAMGLHRRSGRMMPIARTLVDLGWAMQVGGRLDEARTCYDRALTMTGELGLLQEHQRAEFYDLFCRLQARDSTGVADKLTAAMKPLVEGGLTGFLPLIHLAVSCALLLDGEAEPAIASLRASDVLESADIQFTHCWLLEHAGFLFAEAAEQADEDTELKEIGGSLLRRAIATYDRTDNARRSKRCRQRLEELEG